MGNFDFKCTIHLIEDFFQSLVQVKWYHSFVTEFNLLYIHTKPLDDGTMPVSAKVLLALILSATEGQKG